MRLELLKNWEKNLTSSKNMYTYCFDLDGTLCSHEPDYNLALPFYDRIEKVNKLYYEGNAIII